MTRPVIATLVDTPVAISVVTPRLRRIESSSVPWKGDTPWSRATGGDGAGLSFDAVEKVRAKPPHRTGQLDGRQAPQQLLEHQLDLQPREVRAETEVLADAEGEMIVRRARDVEALGLGEHLLV